MATNETAPLANRYRGDQVAVQTALAGIQQTLALDGYRLDIDHATTRDLSVSITALENACEECLAPVEVLRMIISGGLDGAYLPDEIELRLPATGADGAAAH